MNVVRTGRGRLAVLAMLVTGLALAACGTSSARVPATASEVPRIQPAELKQLLDRRASVIVVDTRPAEAFDASHIPGAVSMPYAEIEARQGELDKNAKIVTYCT